MRRGATLGVTALALWLAPSLASTAAEGPWVALVVPGTDVVLGRLSRSDGSFPFGVDATNDRAACMMDPVTLTIPQLRALVREARRDRIGAYRRMIGLTEGCMTRKGWRFLPCGEATEPDCPAAPPKGTDLAPDLAQDLARSGPD